MPITSSAKKALRASKKKRVYNLRRKSMIDSIIKDIEKSVGEMKVKEALALLPSLHKAADKAAKTNFIKKNTAARIKSRALALIRKAEKKLAK